MEPRRTLSLTPAAQRVGGAQLILQAQAAEKEQAIFLSTFGVGFAHI